MTQCMSIKLLKMLYIKLIFFKVNKLAYLNKYK